MTSHQNILAVASGKGGVGKTWLTVTLAHAATKAGRRVIVLDGDIGLANIDIQLGLAPTRDLSLWAAGKADLASLAQPTPAGFDLIPGASGSGVMAGVGGAEIARLVGEFANLAAGYDFGMIDISAGVEPAQIRLAGAARRCLLVITEDPTSLTDGYAFVKVAQRLKRPPTFEVVVNMAESADSGAKAHAALSRACKSFLGVETKLLGVVRRDPAVAAAIRRQAPLLETARGAAAASDVNAILAAALPSPARAA